MHNDNIQGRTDQWFKENQLADFSKRRFTQQLRQEKPRFEQDTPDWERNAAIALMIKLRCPTAIWTVGTKLSIWGFNFTRGHTSELAVRDGKLWTYKLRKDRPATNANPISRFMRPSPDL